MRVCRSVCDTGKHSTDNLWLHIKRYTTDGVWCLLLVILPPESCPLPLSKDQLLIAPDLECLSNACSDNDPVVCHECTRRGEGIQLYVCVSTGIMHMRVYTIAWACLCTNVLVYVCINTTTTTQHTSTFLSVVGYYTLARGCSFPEGVILFGVWGTVCSLCQCVRTCVVYAYPECLLPVINCTDTDLGTDLTCLVSPRFIMSQGSSCDNECLKKGAVAIVCMYELKAEHSSRHVEGNLSEVNYPHPKANRYISGSLSYNHSLR